MVLVVEDGTGLESADAFVSIVDADTYHTAQGSTGWTGDTADKEAAIRRATGFLSKSYDWRGERIKGRSQSLAWPRKNAYDADGEKVDDASVPQEIADAAAELALREMTTPGFLTPDIILTDRIKMEQVGPLKTEYADTALSADSARPIVSVVENLIAGLLQNGGNQSTKFVDRA